MDKNSKESEDLPLPSMYWKRKSSSTFQEGISEHSPAKHGETLVTTACSDIVHSTKSETSKSATTSTRIWKRRKIPDKGPIVYSESDSSDAERETENRGHKRFFSLSGLGNERKEDKRRSNRCSNSNKQNLHENAPMYKKGTKSLVQILPRRTLRSNQTFNAPDSSECQLDSGKPSTVAKSPVLTEQSLICKRSTPRGKRYSDKPSFLGISKSRSHFEQTSVKELTEGGSLVTMCGTGLPTNDSYLASKASCEKHKSTDSRACERLSREVEKNDPLSSHEKSVKKNVGPSDATHVDFPTLNKVPKKCREIHFSDPDLDSSEMEQSFYTSGSLKISRSRFGAFRRKNYKFAPIIFSHVGERGRKAASKPKTTLGSNKKNSQRSDCFSERGITCDHKITNKSSTKPPEADCSMPTRTVASDNIDNCEIYHKINNVASKTADSEEAICNETSYKTVIAPCSRGENIVSNVGGSTSKSFISENGKNLMPPDVSCDCFVAKTKSPQNVEKKLYFTLTDLFFTDEKPKPAPSRKRTLDSNLCREEMSVLHETTLLDDNNLWSLPKK